MKTAERLTTVNRKLIHFLKVRRVRQSGRDKYLQDMRPCRARQIRNSPLQPMCPHSSLSARPLRNRPPVALPAAPLAIHAGWSLPPEDQASLFQNCFPHKSLESISKAPSNPESAR